MKVYLAGPYQWKDQIIGYANAARAVGIEITSFWLEEPHDSKIQLKDLPEEEHTAYALRDLRDIDAADALVLFAVPPTDTPIPRAGRHVEFGYALAQGLEIFVVGGKENIFHYLPWVKHVETWADALELLINRTGEATGL